MSIFRLRPTNTMSQSLAAQTTSSLKPSPITVEDVRDWAQNRANGNTKEMLQLNVDENVEWMTISPADGPLGRTAPIAG